MLILTRRIGEALMIGDHLKVTVLKKYYARFKVGRYDINSCMTKVSDCEIGEVLAVSDEVKIHFLSLNGNQVKLGIDAPKSISVHREEIYKKILAEKSAA